MATETIENDLSNLTLKGTKEINILLLGETGVGKSTFINSMINYLEYEDFQKAEKSPLIILINSMFKIQDNNGDLRTVEVGSKDPNEYLNTGSSATQGVKTYSFLLSKGKTMVRFIDTPGMGDTRGIEKDQENCENILNYLGRLQHLHAICYLAKSQQSRATIYFEYCVTQILSRLEKSACHNIIFVFTHTKGSNYSAGDTYELFRKLVDEIKKNPAHADIPLDRNVFCLDNEAFRALAALQKGIELDSRVKKGSIESWRVSTKECWNMINYISTLSPHLVRNTAAINEARRLIYQLSQPMADIAQLINDNIQILGNHYRNLDVNKQSLSELRKQLFIPVIDLQVTKLTQPVTVCGDLACSEAYNVDNKKEWHYKTRCHDPCYLQNVPRDILGSPELIHCASMGANQTCTRCSHSYKVHLHVYYMTKKVESKQRNNIVAQNINTQEQGISAALKVIDEIEKQKTQHERELDLIIKYNAKFAHFLLNNAIAPFSDSYANYITYLIERENSLGNNADIKKLAGLQKLLRQHNETKKFFSEAAELQNKFGRADEVTPEDISSSINELFQLRLNGRKIKELFESQEKSMQKEYKFSQYVHKGVIQQSTPDDRRKKNDNEKGKSSASNPTKKFQRDRLFVRGNSNNQQRGRGNSSGPQHRDRPPSYQESTRNAPYENRGGPVYPPPPPQEPPYNRAPPQTPRYSDGYRSDERPSVNVNVTLPTSELGISRDPPPRDNRDPYWRDSYYHQPPPPGHYPPYYYREGYPPYYPPGDTRYSNPPPPHHYGPPTSDYRPPPPHDYRYDPRYSGPSPSAHYPPRNDDHRRPYDRNRPQNSNPPHDNRNQNRHNGEQNNRGSKNRGGIKRNYRKKDNVHSNNGNDSDTSTASSSYR